MQAGYNGKNRRFSLMQSSITFFARFCSLVKQKVGFFFVKWYVYGIMRQ